MGLLGDAQYMNHVVRHIKRFIDTRRGGNILGDAQYMYNVLDHIKHLIDTETTSRQG